MILPFSVHSTATRARVRGTARAGDTATETGPTEEEEEEVAVVEEEEDRSTMATSRTTTNIVGTCQRNY